MIVSRVSKEIAVVPNSPGYIRETEASAVMGDKDEMTVNRSKDKSVSRSTDSA